MAELKQGQVFWLDDEEPVGSEPGFRRPWVIVQNDRTNETRIGTVIACPITGVERRRGAPGNVALQVGEGGLPFASVVVVSGVSAFDRREFANAPVGTLARRRVAQIVAGILLLITPE